MNDSIIIEIFILILIDYSNWKLDEGVWFYWFEEVLVALLYCLDMFFFLSLKIVWFRVIPWIVSEIDTLHSFFSFCDNIREVCSTCEMINEVRMVRLIVECSTRDVADAMIAENGRMFNRRVWQLS